MPIQKTIEKYLEMKKESENIKKEIQQYKKTFNLRLKSLQKEMDLLSKSISSYLEEHNHPAITYKGMTIKLNESKSMKGKKKISRKNKEQSLKDIKQNYNLSDDCVQELHKSLLGIQEVTKKIKIA